MAERGAQNKNGKKCEKRCKRLTKFLEKVKGGISVSLIVIIVIHIASIIIGSLSLDKCPVNRNIPIFLIAIGVTGICTKVLGLSRDLLAERMNIDPIICLVGIIEFVFFICGSAWVFAIFQPSYNAYEDLYCNKTAYLFAFVYLCCTYLILLISLLAALVLGVTCLMACSCLCKDEENAGISGS